MEYSDLKYLSVDLPEDIRRLKDIGDFERMNRVIDLRLKSNVPEPMKKRLELERAMSALLPGAYPFSRAEAIQILDGAIREFQPEELDHLRDLDAADWVFIDGEERYRRNFLSNLIKTRPDIAARVKDVARLDYARRNIAMLDEAIEKMQERGELAYRYRVRALVQVKPESVRPGKALRVHIPVPIEGAQMEDVQIHSCSHAPAKIAAPDYPQRTVCFEGVYAPDTVFQVEYFYTNRMRYVAPDPANVLRAQPRFYLEELPPHIRFTPYLRDLAARIVGREENPLEKARLIYDYLTRVPTYSFMPPYFTVADLTGFMATRMKGDCGVFALLFITLCRISGVPARWQSGLYTTPIEIGMHDWAQFYVAPYGWLYADASFGNSARRNGAEHRRAFYFGNLDPFRMVAASEFQHEFDPPRKYMRYDPYDNQDGEAEYEDMPLSNGELLTEQVMLELREL
ncbi:MAG: transglutaminase-like domain-containing protein [Christensenellales bacterium]